MSRRLVFSFAAYLAALTGAGLVFSLAAVRKAEAETEAPTPHTTSVADALSEEVRTVFANTRGAVVKIEASDKNGELCGTGFFIDPSGTLVTSFSVGGESTDIIVSSGEAKYPARRLLADCRSGIAILRIEKTAQALPYLPMGKSSDLSIAAPVMSIAYPMDMPLTPNFGMVAGFNLKYLNRFFATTHIRANVPVQRGEGGAPLLNMRGEVVGVVISGLDGGASCFALPIEAVAKLHRDYVRFGAIRPGWLGVMVERAEAGEAQQGSTARVTGVMEEAPALEAGILPGDLILKIGEVAVKTPEDVINASFFLTAGDSVPVTVWRGEEAVTLDVEPVEREKPGPSRKRLKPAGPIGIPFGTEDITLRTEH